MKLHRFKKDIGNQGFSLVELLIAVAIATIVGGAVFGFMSVGAKNFSWNSSEVNLQNESQLAFNQMQELIIDTAVGVEYYKCAYDESSNAVSSEVKVEKDSDIGDSDDKMLRLNNTDVVYEIVWDRDDSKLYYGEFDGAVTTDHATGESVVTKGSSKLDTDYVLMSEYITGFAADLSRLISNRVVRVDLDYEKGGRTLSTSHNITLRNQVVSSNKLERQIREAYTLSSNKIPSSIEGKSVIYVEPGQTINLMTDVVYEKEPGVFVTGYHVKDNEGAEMLNEARFRCSGHLPGQTRIGNATGILEVSKNEMADFTVTVYSQHNPDPVTCPPLDVEIRVVRVTSLSVNFIKDTRDNVAKDENENNKFEDDLVAGETFKLDTTIVTDAAPYGKKG